MSFFDKLKVATQTKPAKPGVSKSTPESRFIEKVNQQIKRIDEVLAGDPINGRSDWFELITKEFGTNLVSFKVLRSPLIFTAEPNDKGFYEAESLDALKGIYQSLVHDVKSGDQRLISLINERAAKDSQAALAKGLGRKRKS
ncbi:hypothetical protein A6A04_02640 [Paramagnetospirillum marisnigri]|uniref:Uncharacterized protein n=1 Tax=Paramagnetospirillum marisnigri TaxID=1285242 RepID=A0A178MQU4_9PROT|nr:hypothetical protein [Paramagnetospirillum marisnigri]OAN50314.1 hypothetical protein A6A04_02640 [Paramagnetospirillum marisnigri]